MKAIEAREQEIEGFLIVPEDVPPVVAQRRNIFNLKGQLDAAGITMIQANSGKFYLHPNGAGPNAKQMAVELLQRNNFRVDPTPRKLFLVNHLSPVSS